jgi:NTE family protein
MRSVFFGLQNDMGQKMKAAHKRKPAAASPRVVLPGQAVLVLQGGGALGAFQVGAYEAMHEAGIEPDWVIGTSIGAINGAIIAGNPPERRINRLHAFWEGVQQHNGDGIRNFFAAFGQTIANLSTITRGIPTFFTPGKHLLQGTQARVGIEEASYYSTAPLRDTLTELVDLDYLNARHTRLTVGAVNARTGEMRYFDSREETITISHIMASGALPPAFPAVRIDGEPYWDGGIFSNTPVEAVLDDNPRRNSVIFTTNLWNPEGPEPESIWEVMGREKDIQYASRAKSHIARQQQIHHLRHIIRELAQHVPAKAAKSAAVSELKSWGCGTTMHVVPLVAPARAGEDQLKDIDFTPDGISTRIEAGIEEGRRAIAAAPWRQLVDPMEGVIVHGNV